ncbi:MAG: tyrosine-type recombinase/integrase [Planctomycetota bacterium]|nr:tyrosine-type recombinase/integrase [Planctomycetota bacterium]
MGRVFRPVYYVRDPETGQQVQKQSKYLHIEWTDAYGRTRHRKAGLKEAVARNALRKAEAEVLDEKNGLPSRAAGDIPCQELREKYLTAQKARVTPHHHKIVTQRLDAVLEATRAYVVKRLTPDALEAYLTGLQDKGLSARSANLYLQAVKGMLTWAVHRRMLPYNPLDCVKPRPEIEKRYVRRALTEDEIPKVLAAALDGPMRRASRVYQNRPRKNGTFKPANIPLAKQAVLAEEGRRMVLIYRIYIETGLRRNEARLLTWADLDIEARTLTTRPEWCGNKSGKRDVIPLTPGLCEALTEWRARHPAPDTARVVKITDRVLRKFDDDLVAAGLARRVPLDRHGDLIPLGDDGKPTAAPAEWAIDKKDAAGRTLDIHALRHTCGSRLVAAGVDIRTAQSIMRHSTPTMTLGIYCHTDRKRMAAAMESLPELKLAPVADPNREGRAVARTGTDDAPVDDDPRGGTTTASRSSERRATAQTAPSTRDQQGTVPLSDNGNTYNVLQENGRTFPKPKVVGPSPIARLDLQERKRRPCLPGAYDRHFTGALGHVWGRSPGLSGRIHGEKGGALSGKSAYRATSQNRSFHGHASGPPATHCGFSNSLTTRATMSDAAGL